MAVLQMRAAMAPGLAPAPTSDAFGAFPSDSMSGLGSQFGSGLGIPDLARTNRGGSGGMGSGALPGSSYVPPMRGDSGLFGGVPGQCFCWGFQTHSFFPTFRFLYSCKATAAYSAGVEVGASAGDSKTTHFSLHLASRTH